MKNRMLPKAALVAAMGAAALLTPKPAMATAGFGPCYVCYQADGCPDQDTGNALCAEYTPCQTMVGCIDTAGQECLYPGVAEVYCGN